MQKFTPAINRIALDPEVRQILIDSLAFKNGNSECKKVIGPLKARSAAMDEWIRNTDDIEFHTCDPTLIGEVISKGFKRRQTVR